jgi:hypothetical protein
MPHQAALLAMDLNKQHMQIFNHLLKKKERKKERKKEGHICAYLSLRVANKCRDNKRNQTQPISPISFLNCYSLTMLSFGTVCIK